jgi:hypothetical protein
MGAESWEHVKGFIGKFHLLYNFSCREMRLGLRVKLLGEDHTDTVKCNILFVQS